MQSPEEHNNAEADLQVSYKPSAEMSRARVPYIITEVQVTDIFLMVMLSSRTSFSLQHLGPQSIAPHKQT